MPRSITNIGAFQLDRIEFREAGSLDLRQENIEYRSGILVCLRRPSILAAPIPKKACGLFTFGPFQETSRRFRPPEFLRAD
jgi:hypothetical protein